MQDDLLLVNRTRERRDFKRSLYKRNVNKTVKPLMYKTGEKSKNLRNFTFINTV